MYKLMRQAGVSLVLAAPLAISVEAAELTIEPRLAAGASYYNLDIDDVEIGNNSFDRIEFSDWLYLVGGGLTFSYDRFFLDLYGQYGFDGDDDLDVAVNVGGETNNLAQDVEFDRIETAITAGYRVTDQFAAFVGIRYADVDFDGSGSNGAIDSDLSVDFEQTGPFIGAAYVIPKTVFNGTFVANAAVAYLDGDLEADLDVAGTANDVAVNIDGDALGINAGASWVTPLTGQLKLVVGADVAYYNYGQADIEETITRLRTELRYSFDSGLFGSN